MPGNNLSRLTTILNGTHETAIFNALGKRLNKPGAANNNDLIDHLIEYLNNMVKHEEGVIAEEAARALVPKYK